MKTDPNVNARGLTPFMLEIKSKIIFLKLLVAFCISSISMVFGDLAEKKSNEIYIGEWQCNLKDGQILDAYAYAQSYRYPKSLRFVLNGEKLKIFMIDANGVLSEIENVYVLGNDVVFWSDRGVKEGIGRYPIHRTTINKNTLEGVVITDEILFRYVGTKTKMEQSEGTEK